MVTQLNQDEQAGFAFAVQLYTKLLFEQKELLTGIIEVAYAQGIQEGIVYAQQQILAANQAQVEEQVEVPDENPFGEEEYSEQPQPQQPQQQPQHPQPQQQQQPKSTPPPLTSQEMSKFRSPAEELIAKMKGVKR